GFGPQRAMLAGVHVGCFVLFGHEGVHGIAGLKEKTVGVPGFGTGAHLLLTLMAAEGGLDPRKDPARRVKEGGWPTPVLVSEDGGLTAGHARVHGYPCSQWRTDICRGVDSRL